MSHENIGYAGMAIILPNVWQEVDKNVTDEMIEYDEQAEHVANTLIDLTESMWGLGEVIRSDSSRVALKNRAKNNELYDASVEILIGFTKSKIETLFNYAMIIGQMTLRLLETMYIYLHLLETDSIDEWAWTIVDHVKRSVFDN